VYVRPTLQGKPLTFGVSGKLWKDALIMYDRETGSLWSQLGGVALRGPLAGTILRPVPALHTTWEHWRGLHPGTQVLSKQAPFGQAVTDNAYGSYVANEKSLGIFGTVNPDRRLPGKEVVLGLRLGAERIAFPFRYLSRQPLTNEVVGDQPLLVVFSSRDGTGVVFSRQAANRVLTFANLRQERGTWIVDDRETGSAWRAFEGRATAGRLAGTRLEQLPANVSFWFAWRNIFPTTRLWLPE
jgi:hypothetical protein